MARLAPLLGGQLPSPAGSEDALLDDVLRLTLLLLLLLELTLRLTDRELKPLVDAVVEEPFSESERSNASAEVAEEKRKGRSLPSENTSSATHISAASSPASASPPDESMQNSKSSSGAADGTGSFSASVCERTSSASPDRPVGAVLSWLAMDGFVLFWLAGGEVEESKRCGALASAFRFLVWTESETDKWRCVPACAAVLGSIQCSIYTCLVDGSPNRCVRFRFGSVSNRFKFKIQI